MEPIRKWYTANMEKRQKNSNFLQGFKTMTEAIMNGNKDIEDLEKYIAEHVEVELDTKEMQKIKRIIELIYLNYGRTRSEEIQESEKEHGIRRQRCLECGKRFENLEELRVHEENCYSCEQCDNWYKSREDLEDHIRRRHTKYNCDQCDNWYESREDLEDHRERRHSKECEEKLECRNEREQQNKEEHRNGPECDLCEEKFNNENELV